MRLCTAALAKRAAQALEPFVDSIGGTTRLRTGWHAVVLNAVGPAMQGSSVAACLPITVQQLSHVVLHADTTLSQPCAPGVEQHWDRLFGNASSSSMCSADAQMAATASSALSSTAPDGYTVGVHSAGAIWDDTALDDVAELSFDAWQAHTGVRRPVWPAVQLGTTPVQDREPSPARWVAGLALVHSMSARGVQHGVTRLLSMFRMDGLLPAAGVAVVDAPRHAWRGFSLDTARHWQPVDRILATLDYMEAAHLNTLHWHVSDAQALPLAVHMHWNLSRISALVHRAHVRRHLVYCGDDKCAVAVHALNMSEWVAINASQALTARMISQREVGLRSSEMRASAPQRPAFAAYSATHLAATLSTSFVAPLSLHHVYFSEHIEAVLQAAAARGIRVMFEVDTPAHTASWAWAWASWAAEQVRVWAVWTGQETPAAWRTPDAINASSPAQWVSWEWYKAKQGPRTAERAGVPPQPTETATTGAAARAFFSPGLVVPCHAAGSPTGQDTAVHAADKYALHPGHPGVDAVVHAILVHALPASAALHLGGDEVAPQCWAEVPAVVDWARAHSAQLGLQHTRWELLGTPQGEVDAARMAAAALTAYLARVHYRLPKNVTTVVWQGAFDAAASVADGGPALPARVAVQAWKCWGGLDRAAMRGATAEGRAALRASCWYLDYDDTSEAMYAHMTWSGERGGMQAQEQPTQAGIQLVAHPASTMPASAFPLVWGGEVAAWGERMTAYNLLCRAWPRAAVVAERLWSWAPYSGVVNGSSVQSLGANVRNWHAAAPRLAAWTRKARQMLPHTSAHIAPAAARYVADWTGSWRTTSDACPLVHQMQHPQAEVPAWAPVEASHSSTSTQTRRVLQFNIANGGTGLWKYNRPPEHAAQLPFFAQRAGQTRLAAVLDWVRSRDADVVSMIELNGWELQQLPLGARALGASRSARECPRGAVGAGDIAAHTACMQTRERVLTPGTYSVTSSPALAAAAAHAGYAHAALLVTPSGYHMGLLSRWPVVVLAWNTHNFERGMLVVRTAGVVYIVVHLHAHSATARRGEAVVVARAIQRWGADGSVPTIVLGDFNTLSPEDSAWHTAQGMAQWLASSAVPTRVAAKHLLPDRSAIDYTPMHTLLAAGVTDLCSVQEWPQDATSVVNTSQVPGSAHRGAGPCLYTEPTAYSLIEDVQPVDMPAFRLDYVLGNAALQQRGGMRCAVVQTAESAVLSDHFPLECVETLT